MTDSARDLVRALEIALDKLADSLGSSHDGDCPYGGNHKGALEWYDSCDCWVGSSLRPMYHDLDEIEERLRAGGRK